MKKNTLSTLLCMVVAAFSIHAGNINDSIENSINEDSLIAQLYPSVTLHRMDSATYERLKAEYGTAPKKSRPKRSISAPVTGYSVDRTKAVGEIPIKSGVSPTGARTYEVPINVPEGLNGFTPKLSIAYNSQQGNSSLGMGWGIGGLDVITRTPRSYYYDYSTEGISLDNNDCFALSGQRLIHTHDSDGCRWFKTETGNIKAKGYLNNGHIYYFDVFYPDGTKGIFGSHTSGDAKLCYPVIYRNDLHGNHIDYDYLNVSGIDYISKITYNNAEIRFNYSDSRTDPKRAFSAGVSMYCNKLLESIVSSVNNQTLGTYSLSYVSRYGTSVIDRISYQCGNDAYNPLKFIYGNSEQESYEIDTVILNAPYYIYDDPKKLRALRGKFDYFNNDDGILVYPNKLSYSQRSLGYGIEYVNNYRYNDTILVYTNIGKSYWPDVNILTTGSGFLDIISLDLKGQQKENIVRINNSIYEREEDITFTVYDFSANILYPSYYRSFTLPLVRSSHGISRYCSQPKFFYPGDFNGDGRMEIFAVSTYEGDYFENAGSRCYIFDLETNQLLFDDYLFQYYYIGERHKDPYEANDNSDKVFVFDYDGDGKTDVGHITTIGLEIYTFENSSDGYACRKVHTYPDINISLLQKRQFRTGDFNGDGLMDILVSSKIEPHNTRWSIFYSKGDGSFYKCDFDGLATYQQIDNIVIQDIDGDGMSDMIKYEDNSDQFCTYIARNNEFSNIGKTTFSSGKPLLIPSDINSHNRYSRFITLDNNILTRYSFGRHAPRDIMLRQMTNSLGIVEVNRYERTDDSDDNIYSPGYMAAFPYVNMNEATVVLAESAIYMNGEQIDHNDFQYENAVAHRQGRGFCGFERIWQHTYHRYSLERKYDPYRFGILTHESSPMAEKDLEYSISIDSDKFVDIRLTKTTEKDLLKGITATARHEYDRFGYPAKSVVTYPDDITVTTENTYHCDTVDGDGYNLGYLIDRKVTTCNGDNEYSEREKIQSHIHRNPLVTLSYVNDNQVSRTANDFDAHGQLIVEQKKAYSSETQLRTDYQYDDCGRATSITNPLGLANSYTYDSRGYVRTKTDHLGGVTSYTYDDFGRLTRTLFPDSTIQTVNYDWVFSDNRLYSITTQTTGQPTTVVYYDALNRKVRQSETRFDCSVLNTDYSYDRYGNLAAVSLPFKDDSPSLWNTYEYDFYNRPVSETKATGWKKTCQYDKTSTTVTAGGVTSKKTYNALGQLIKAEDSGGTITYELGADGQPESITAPGGITTTFTYDDYRRRTAMNDPSFGLVRYEYDEAGNQSGRTDADGRSVTHSYDSFNRKTATTSEEGVTRFTYDEYDRLIKVAADNGAETTSAFDGLGRLASSKESYNGKWLNRRYSYSGGNVASISYSTSSGMSVSEKYHYSNGHLKQIDIENVLRDPTFIADENGIREISGGTMTGYTLNQENALGLPTKISSDIVDYTFGYTDTGLLKSRNAGAKQVAIFMPHTGIDLPGIGPFAAPSGGVIPRDSTLIDIPIDPLEIYTPLYAIDYTYSGSNGNLRWKGESEYDTGDDFDYDNLNRLTGSPFNRVRYDVKGNIVHMSEFGDFTYETPGKPYAVSGASLLDLWGMPARQQISYTSQSRPSTITSGDNKALLTYNGANDRVRMELYAGGQNTLTRYYFGGCYELDETPDGSTEKLYLTGDYYSADIVIVQKNGKRSPYGIVRDELGSITHVTGGAKSIQQNVRYDAWGSLRDPESQHIYTSEEAPELFLGRGFTGHEHLPQFGLINMNARLYDPILGRFLSPDPYVQMPDFTQNFNRYAYCMNNPLSYVDQDGEFFWFIIGAAVIGGITNVAVHWKDITAAGGWNGILKGAGYFAVGGLAGGAAASLGVASIAGFGAILTTTGASIDLVTTGIIVGAKYGAVTGVTAGFIEDTGNSLLEGNSLSTSLSNGLKGGLIGGITGGVAGGIMGGAQAALNGQNILTGEVQKYSGYFGKDEYGNIYYVGITGRDPQIRFREHLNSGTERALLMYKTQRHMSTWLSARIWEQNKIK